MKIIPKYILLLPNAYSVIPKYTMLFPFAYCYSQIRIKYVNLRSVPIITRKHYKMGVDIKYIIIIYPQIHSPKNVM